MPPFKPVVSKSQSRALFAKAGRGDLPLADAKGKTAAADFDDLPERIGGKKSTSRGKKASPRRTMVRGK